MTHDPLTWDNLFGADPNYVNMPSDYEAGQRDMLAKCIAAVEAVPKEDGGYCHVMHACDVEEALRALQEKP